MVRIQLASNYQVVELTYDSFESMGVDDLETAVKLVNSLGTRVQANPNQKQADKPTDAQLQLAKKLKIDCDGMSKEQVRLAIQAACNKE